MFSHKHGRSAASQSEPGPHGAEGRQCREGGAGHPPPRSQRPPGAYANQRALIGLGRGRGGALRKGAARRVSHGASQKERGRPGPSRTSGDPYNIGRGSLCNCGGGLGPEVCCEEIRARAPFFGFFSQWLMPGTLEDVNLP